MKYLKILARRTLGKVITDIDNYLRNKRERGELKNTDKRKNTFSPVLVIFFTPVLGIKIRRLVKVIVCLKLG